MQNLASIQPRTSLVKFARSPRTDPSGSLAFGELKDVLEDIAQSLPSLWLCDPTTHPLSAKYRKADLLGYIFVRNYTRAARRPPARLAPRRALRRRGRKRQASRLESAARSVAGSNGLAHDAQHGGSRRALRPSGYPGTLSGLQRFRGCGSRGPKWPGISPQASVQEAARSRPEALETAEAPTKTVDTC